MERISHADLPPGMFNHLHAIEAQIFNSPLDDNLVELVKLRISQENGCSYCVDMHHKELKHAEETDLRLSSLCVWEETPYFSGRERAVLKFAEKLSKAGAKPLPEVYYTELLEYFNKEEISYLTLVVAQINTWNTLMKVFRFTPGNYEVVTQL